MSAVASTAASTSPPIAIGASTTASSVGSLSHAIAHPAATTTTTNAACSFMSPPSLPIMRPTGFRMYAAGHVACRRPGFCPGHRARGQTAHRGRSAGPAAGPGAQWEKVVGDLKFSEGPAWHPEGYLLFEDTPRNRTMKLDPDDKVSVFREPSGRANGLAWDARGPPGRVRGELLGGGGRRVIRLDKDGKARCWPSATRASASTAPTTSPSTARAASTSPTPATTTGRTSSRTRKPSTASTPTASSRASSTASPAPTASP